MSLALEQTASSGMSRTTERDRAISQVTAVSSFVVDSAATRNRPAAIFRGPCRSAPAIPG